MRLNRAQARQRNHDALIAAAMVEMADNGYTAARLEDIAARAEVTTGAIYSIFGSKQDLMLAAVRQLADDFAAGLLPLEGSEETLAETLREIATAYHRAAVGPPAQQRLAFELELMSLALRDPVDGRKFIQAIPQRSEDVLTRLLTGRRITAHPRAPRTTAEQARRLSPAVASLLGGLLQRAVIEPGSVDEEYCARAAVALVALTR
ncbi:TetR/AcrR family transcriptional regulator [Amycolatopsis japonica]|uniref:TetR/AcrR family transcriptional regulator n=1 Tax=Amycolatopsis japonica TaxID=208439 RepID=UPI0037B9B9BE